MGNKITLAIAMRDVHGKKVKQLRRDGLIPAVVYGADMEPISVQADKLELTKVIKEAGRHTPVHLTGSKKRIAMVKEVDIDPAKNDIRHVSFHAVRADEQVVTEVAIRLIGEGESEAERAGLVVLQALDRIEIKALPMELPEALELSILGLKEEGDRVTVGDIVLPEGVELVERVYSRHEEDDEDEERQTLSDLVVATVYEPGALQAANEAAAGDATDESEVESDQGSDATDESSESKPDGKSQDESKEA